MSKTLKRLVGLLLAAMMVLSFLPALAEGEEPIVITVGGRNSYGTDVNEMVYMKYLEEKFNVDFQCDWFYTNDAIETQFTLMLADDNLPDLMLGYDLPKLECDRYGQEGFLLDLSQYLDIMPDFKAQLDADPALNAFCRDENGAIYGIYKTRGNLCSREVAMSYINKAWLERVGMDYPTTTEELYQVLKAFKEQDANGNGDPNDEIPLSFTFDQYSGTRAEFPLRASFGIYGYKNNYQLQVTDGKVWLGDASENWKEYVKYMHRLYAEGLLDNDCFIMTNDEYQAKTREGKLGYFGSWSVLTSVFNVTDRRVYLDYIFVNGFKSDLVDEIIYPLWNPVTETAVDYVSASAKHPEKICEILNYLYTEQGKIEAWLCCDGVDGKLVEGPYGILTADHTGYFEESGMSFSDWFYSHSRVNNSLMVTQYSMAQALVDEASVEQLKAYIDEAAQTDDPNQQVLLIDAYKDYYTRQVKTCSDYPQVTYTNEEVAERTPLYTDISSYIKTMKAQFITGEVDVDAGWDNYIQTLKAMGLDRLMEIEQGAYDRYAVKLK